VSTETTLGVFRDEIDKNIDLQLHVGRGADIDRSMFHSYLRDVLMANIQLCRRVHGLSDAPAVLLMDDYMTLLEDETM
jgi:hypothetical protein